MGQQLSKRIMPHISKAMETHESSMAKDALQDVARKQAHARSTNTKYSDPSAMQGFKRDQWTQQESLPSERYQHDFYAPGTTTSSATSGSSAGSTEKTNPANMDMPQDLLKFLNDAGPLDKIVDKERTSPKVYEALLEKDEERKQQKQQDGRRRRIMPMVENNNNNNNTDATAGAGAGEEMEMKQDGTTVSRTTNFSTATREHDDESLSKLRLDDLQMFQLLSGLQADSITADQYVEQYFSSNGSGSGSGSGNRMEENLQLVQQMKEYTAIPTLMQDTDKSFVGAWDDGNRLEELKLMGLRMAGEKVRLTFHQLQKETAEASANVTANANAKKSVDDKKQMTTAEFLRQAKQTSAN